MSGKYDVENIMVQLENTAYISDVRVSSQFIIPAEQ